VDELLGRKLLVSLAWEGMFSREGLQSLDEDCDMLTAIKIPGIPQKGGSALKGPVGFLSTVEVQPTSTTNRRISQIDLTAG
jgi:hypothetical protein